MLKKLFPSLPIEHERVVAAIRTAELRTSGEIRVLVSRRGVPDPIIAAQGHFARLNMTQTRQRNAVLIFVAPRSRNFAVIGDSGVHEKCGNAFWQQLAGAMEQAFRAGDFTGGLVHGIERAGELLAAHFPRTPDDKNELPDEIAEA